MYKIILIEDDETISLGLTYYLETENFQVINYYSAEEYLKDNINNAADLILLDINLPGMSGFELFEKINKNNHPPVIFLTANNLEVSIVMGLDMGAEDYVTKPFKAMELVSRIRRVIARSSTTKEDEIVFFQNLKIDKKNTIVYKDNLELFLTAIEYRMLLTFINNPKMLFSRQILLENIWNLKLDSVNDNTLTVHIKRLREKIEDDPKNPKIIVTVHGIGYRLGDNDEK